MAESSYIGKRTVLRAYRIAKDRYDVNLPKTGTLAPSTIQSKNKFVTLLVN